MAADCCPPPLIRVILLHAAGAKRLVVQWRARSKDHSRQYGFLRITNGVGTISRNMFRCYRFQRMAIAVMFLPINGIRSENIEHL